MIKCHGCNLEKDEKYFSSGNKNLCKICWNERDSDHSHSIGKYKRRQEGPKSDITNKKFGKLLVLKNTRKGEHGRWYWLCKCDCGKEKEISRAHLCSGGTISCGCELNRSEDLSSCWRGYGELSGNLWDSIKRSAEGRRRARGSIPMEIDIKYAWELFLKQDKKCALSDIPLEIKSKRKQKGRTASLDRIDSSKGYVDGNVQWVHKDINIMKNIFSQEYFINMCKLIVEKFNKFKEK